MNNQMDASVQVHPPLGGWTLNGLNRLGEIRDAAARRPDVFSHSFSANANPPLDGDGPIVFCQHEQHLDDGVSVYLVFWWIIEARISKDLEMDLTKQRLQLPALVLYFR